MMGTYGLVLSGKRSPQFFTFDEVALQCRLHPELLKRFIVLGLIEPEAGTANRFRPETVYRLQRGLRLRRDLGISYNAIALVLDLLEHIDQLETRLRQFEGRV